MSQRNLAWLLAVPAMVLFAAVMTAFAPPPEPQYKQVRTVVDVLAEVERNYYRELTPDEKQKLVEDMINGGLQKLDPYSEYFNEEKLKQFAADNKGVFGGIGAYLGIDQKTNRLRIDSPMPESPALEAGIQAGDLIMKIDGKTTDGMQHIDDARSLIKGEPGTKVTLTLRRGEKEFDAAVTRAIIQVHPVKGFRRRADDPARWDYIADPENRIAVIRLIEFSESAGKEMKEALKEAEAAGARAVVLDLRNNPGGLLRLAAEISDLFLPGGYIVRTRDRHQQGRDMKAKDDGTAWESTEKMPMAVLVNRASASAAEIVAAALQDNRRAVVIGERSFGKGSVQKPFEMDDGKTALKLTTELWLTPNEKNIHRWPTSREDGEWGVRPDAGLDVKLTDDEFVQYFLHLKDIELMRPKGQPATPPEPADKAKGEKDKPARPTLDPNFKDRVLEKGLEHLREKLRGPQGAGLKPT